MKSISRPHCPVFRVPWRKTSARALALKLDRPGFESHLLLDEVSLSVPGLERGGSGATRRGDGLAGSARTCAPPRRPPPRRRSGCRRSSSASRRASSGSRAGWARSQAHSWPGSPSSSALAKGPAPPRLPGTVSCGRQRTLVAAGAPGPRAAHLDPGLRLPSAAGRAALPGSRFPAYPSRSGPSGARFPAGAAAASVGTASAGAADQVISPSQTERFLLAKMVPKCPRALFLLLLFLACPESRASQVSVPPSSSLILLAGEATPRPKYLARRIPPECSGRGLGARLGLGFRSRMLSDASRAGRQGGPGLV